MGGNPVQEAIGSVLGGTESQATTSEVRIPDFLRGPLEQTAQRIGAFQQANPLFPFAQAFAPGTPVTTPFTIGGGGSGGVGGLTGSAFSGLAQALQNLDILGQTTTADVVSGLPPAVTGSGTEFSGQTVNIGGVPIPVELVQATNQLGNPLFDFSVLERLQDQGATFTLDPNASFTQEQLQQAQQGIAPPGFTISNVPSGFSPLAGLPFTPEKVKQLFKITPSQREIERFNRGETDRLISSTFEALTARQALGIPLSGSARGVDVDQLFRDRGIDPETGFPSPVTPDIRFVLSDAGRFGGLGAAFGVPGLQRTRRSKSGKLFDAQGNEITPAEALTSEQIAQQIGGTPTFGFGPAGTVGGIPTTVDGQQVAFGLGDILGSLGTQGAIAPFQVAALSPEEQQAQQLVQDLGIRPEGETQAFDTIADFINAAQQTPGLLSREGRTIDVTGLEESPAIRAAQALFEQETAPIISRQARLAGVGQGSAVLNALARANAQTLLPLVQDEFARREREVDRLLGIDVQNLGQLERDITRQVGALGAAVPQFAALGGAETARLLNQIQLQSALGGQERAIRQTALDQATQDFLRRQALAEQALFVPFGATAPSAFGSQVVQERPQGAVSKLLGQII